MPAKTKTFDCVEMKDRIQRALEQEYAGLTDDERRKRIQQKLETSDDPVARTWRALIRRGEARNAGSFSG